MNVKTVASTIALAAAFATAPVHATILFQDDFNADHASSQLNVGSLTNWTIGNGTVDYIRSGSFGISCVGGTGGCLDIDGSTSNAGRITSIATFGLLAGPTYTLDVQLSGNQRGGAGDSVTLGFLNTATLTESTFTHGPIAPGAAFATYSLNFNTVLGGSYRIFVEGVGGDNIGAILDNVVLRDDQSGTIPEPATLLLAGLALVAAGATRRRRD